MWDVTVQTTSGTVSHGGTNNSCYQGLLIMLYNITSSFRRFYSLISTYTMIWHVSNFAVAFAESLPCQYQCFMVILQSKKVYFAIRDRYNYVRIHTCTFYWLNCIVL